MTPISHGSPSVSSHANLTPPESDPPCVPLPAGAARKPPSPEWLARHAPLLAAWAEGLSLGEIGSRMHVTRGVVAGRLNRLRKAGLLPARAHLHPDAWRTAHLSGGAAPPAAAGAASVPAASMKPPRPPRAGAATLSPLPPPPAAVPGAPPSVAAVPAAAREPAPRPVLFRPVTTCCWPIGEPRSPGFRFCGDAAAPGQSYCAEHAGRAFVKRREQEAA